MLDLPVVSVVSLVRARVRAMLEGRYGQEDEQQGEGDQFHGSQATPAA